MENWQENRKESFQLWLYAIQRIDLMIITISGAGIFIIFETLKFAYEKGIPNGIILKIAGVLFVFTIIVNFISQITGKKANDFDMQWCSANQKGGETPTSEQLKKINELNCLAGVYNTTTNNLNTISVVIMICGLLTITGYYLSIPNF
jgi:hypothetical protein